jgi:putative protease
MELLVNPTSYNNALDLIKLGVHQISVGTKELSTSNSCVLSLEEISELVKHKNNTKILILVNRVYFEPDIKGLEEFLIKISKLDIDGVIYCDYAVNQILFEQNIKLHEVYNPETLVVNYGQIPFYLENGISEISLARELSGFNMNEIIKNKQGIKIQINVAGYSYMM